MEKNVKFQTGLCKQNQDEVLCRAVHNALNRFDPECLLDLGAPEDEYDCECRRILIKITMSSTAAEIADAVLNTFTASFGEPMPDAWKVAIGQAVYSSIH